MNVDSPSSQRPSQRPPPYAIDASSLGWLIVGASSLADQVAIEAIRSQPPLAGARSVNSWIAGVHSHHAGRGQQFAIKHHIPHSSDDLAALVHRDHVQCVYIANHPRHHFESVRTALLAGKHVLCEPPLALTLDESQQLAAIADQYALLLAVNFSHRCDPNLIQLKALLASDQLGELIGGRLLNAVLLETRQRTWRLQPSVGGALLHRTLFDIDLLRFLFNDEVAALQAQSTTRVHTENLDEDVQTTLQFKGGKLIVSLYDSFLVPNVDTKLELFGTNGSATVTNCLSLQKNSDLILVGRESAPPPLATQFSTQFSTHSSSANQRFFHTFAAFQHALRTNAKPAASAQDFIAALSVVEAARQSLTHKLWTTLTTLQN